MLNVKIYYLWVTVIIPDICQILQEKPHGKLKMVGESWGMANDGGMANTSFPAKVEKRAQ